MQTPFNPAAIATSSGMPMNAEQAEQFTQPTAPWNWNLTDMPWKIATTSAPQPGGIMQFGELARESAVCEDGGGTLPFVNQTTNKYVPKRKSDIPWTIPPKQHITEERITAHFSGLHISGGDYKQQQQQNASAGGLYANSAQLIQGGLPSDDMPSTSSGKTDSFINSSEPAYQLAAHQFKEKLRNAQRIVLCDGIKPLEDVRQKCTDIPEILLKTIPRACTALIPWQPPPIDAKLLGNGHATAPSAITVADANMHVTKGIKKSVQYDDVELEEYDDGFYDYLDNNNTSNINFNKADDQMDMEDL